MQEFLLPAIHQALRAASINTDKQVQIEKPADKKNGDYSTNIALMLSRECRRNPRDLATELIGHMAFPEGTVEKMEIAGPGFINFFLEPAFIMQSVEHIIREGNGYGSSCTGKGKTAIVEYVSANPTGPLTIGRGRGGVLGDCIANLLSTQGYRVTREYYFNDAGRQMQILGESVRYRYLELCGCEVSFPDTHSQGE